MKKASKLLETPQEALRYNYEKTIICKVKSIRKDDSHPLYLIFENLANDYHKQVQTVLCPTER